MKSKRGFLLAEETLKIIIALISIGFLIYLLTALYFANKSDSDLEFAKATLENLINEIDSGSSSVVVYNPEGWVLVNWPFENEKLLSCAEWESCICLCNEDISTTTLTGLRKDCDKGKVCVEINKEFSIESNREYAKRFLKNSIKIDEVPFTLEINQNDKIISKS